jgi:hypothetical protein
VLAAAGYDPDTIETLIAEGVALDAKRE